MIKLHTDSKDATLVGVRDRGVVAVCVYILAEKHFRFHILYCTVVSSS
jgi:hypothetical protein